MTLKYLKYISTGYPFPPWETVLQFSPGKIDYAVDRPPKGSWSGSCEDFQNEKRIQIETLLSTFKKRVYRLPEEEIICDGECWYLEYQLEGEDKPHKKSGDNAYPPLWSFLMQIIDEVAKQKYTYYSVMVDGPEREYYYLGEAGQYQAGARVRVPFGNYELTGTVTKVEEFDEDYVPLSLDKMKEILGPEVRNTVALGTKLYDYINEKNIERWEMFPDTMKELGFVMDCYKSYEELFASKMPDRRLSEQEEQDEILANLEKSDVQIVGNFIFSRWRVLTHWEESDYSGYDSAYFFPKAFKILADKLGVEL